MGSPAGQPQFLWLQRYPDNEWFLRVTLSVATHGFRPESGVETDKLLGVVLNACGAIAEAEGWRCRSSRRFRMAVGALNPVSGSLWEAISKIAAEEGVTLFDMDLPGGGESGHGGILRVYIYRPKGAEPAPVEEPQAEGDEEHPRRTGVSFEDCTRVAKRILDVDEQEGLIPEGCLLEVSSPGVNRTLRRAEHFGGAVGERVRLKFREPSGSYRVATGILAAVDGEALRLETDERDEVVNLSLRDVKDARVDFKF